MYSNDEIKTFYESLLDYYAHHRRDMPWRDPEPDGSFDPYKIYISEVMLQQTQAPRVIPKFIVFIERFPDVRALAAAPFHQVLSLWSGLGYNRRARYLHEGAKHIEQHGFPNATEGLVVLPGVGLNTAGAILAYAFNEPTVFIETNIRSVLLHHFFANRSEVADQELIETLQQLIEEKPAELSYRELYWAFMDYGTFLKVAYGNPNHASKHYVRQSTFNGSKRQLRGQVLRLLLEEPRPEKELVKILPDERLRSVIKDLLKEQLIVRAGTKYKIP